MQTRWNAEETDNDCVHLTVIVAPDSTCRFYVQTATVSPSQDSKQAVKQNSPVALVLNGDGQYSSPCEAPVAYVDAKPSDRYEYAWHSRIGYSSAVEKLFDHEALNGAAAALSCTKFIRGTAGPSALETNNFSDTKSSQ